MFVEKQFVCFILDRSFFFFFFFFFQPLILNHCAICVGFNPLSIYIYIYIYTHTHSYTSDVQKVLSHTKILDFMHTSHICLDLICTDIKTEI